MKRLIYNVVICILALVIIFINGIRLYNTDKSCDFWIANVTDVSPQVNENLSTMHVVYKDDNRWIEADIPDVPKWVLGQIDENSQTIIYFYDGDYIKAHAVPYSPLQDMMIQSMIITVAAFGLIIIGNSIIKNK